jgi:hypothetical protein
MLTLAVASSALAQGKSQPPKKNPPPSRNDLTPSAGAPATSVSGATTYAWIDDASLIDPGAVSIAMSVVRWQGTGVSEVDVPVIDVSIGLAPRVHLTATVPRVVGSADPSGAVGGVGTSYFSAKVAVLNDAKRNVKLSVAPMLEVLGRGVLQSLTSDEGRVHFGFPMSVEVDRGAARLYGGGGYFSRGVWFAGGGAGARASRRTFVSAGYSRSWRRGDAVVIPLSDRARNELTGGASYAVRPNVSLFGSIARTIATLEENGAGTSISGGVSFFVAPARK